MDSYINTLKTDTPILSQIYFSKLTDGFMSLEVFKKSQANFYSAVCYFSRPMFLLCSRIDNYEERLIILENIFDEHGNGKIQDSHGNTYKKYLLTLGVSENDINKTFNHSAVSNFYSIMNKTIRNDNIETSISMFGIMEDRYTEISATIASALINNKWLKETQLDHYKTHKKLDIYHAELFYKLIRHKWANKISQKNIIKGLNLGNKLVLELFNNLLEVN